MMRSSAPDAASCRSHHHGNFELSVRYVEDGGSLLDDFADCLQYKIKEDDIDNRTAPGKRCSDAQPGLTTLRDRSIADALSSELSPQSAALLEISAANTDSLPHVTDARVTTHLFANGFDSRFRIGDEPLF